MCKWCVIPSTQGYFYILQKGLLFLCFLLRCFLYFVVLWMRLFFLLSFLIGCWWCIGTMLIVVCLFCALGLLLLILMFSLLLFGFSIYHDFPLLHSCLLLNWIIFSVFPSVWKLHILFLFFYWLICYFDGYLYFLICVSVYMTWSFKLARLYLWSPLPTSMFLLSYIWAHLCFVSPLIWK